jgi:hypothetical protein
VALQGFGSWRHLAERFVGALSPAGPPPEDEAWATSHLGEGELALWRRMSGPDRRHAVAVARQTVDLLAPAPADRPTVAAALLHDVGKVDSQLGTFARVGVTLAAVAVGRERLLGWTGDAAARGRRSPKVRVGSYLVHDRLGSELLRAAGSDDLTWSWAGEHHLPEDRWSVEPRIGAALKTADGD